MTERELIKKAGIPYSELLGIKLDTKKEREIFKWLFASLLFGKRISEKIALETYNVFKKEDILTPQKLVKTGWDRLVELLDEGGYVRYDYSTATKILKVCTFLGEKYGTLTNLYKKSSSSQDLIDRLEEFYGVGPVTISIFLREMRVIWRKVEIDPADDVKNAAKRLGIKLKKYNKHTKRFIRLECALHRYWKNIR